MLARAQSASPPKDANSRGGALMSPKIAELEAVELLAVALGTVAAEASGRGMASAGVT